MKSLRKSNDIRVSAKFLNALCRHLHAVLKETCAVEGNEKSITKFHIKSKRTKLVKDLVRKLAVRKTIVSIRGGPTRISKVVFASFNTYVAAVCRASVDAAGDAMTVSHLVIPHDPKKTAVNDRQTKPTKPSKTMAHEFKSTGDYKERRHVDAKYAVTIQGMTLQGTKPYVSAYSNDKLQRSIANDVGRMFGYLGIHGNIEVDVYSIEVRKL